MNHSGKYCRIAVLFKGFNSYLNKPSIQKLLIHLANVTRRYTSEVLPIGVQLNGIIPQDFTYRLSIWTKIGIDKNKVEQRFGNL